MSDDELDCTEKKEYPTRVLGTGKELLEWLRPGYSVDSTVEQHTGESGADSDAALDRRSYMVLAGGVAGATVTGTAGSAAGASATETQVNEPDVYGYGGISLRPDGDGSDDDSDGDDDTSGVVGSGEGLYGGIGI